MTGIKLEPIVDAYVSPEVIGLIIVRLDWLQDYICIEIGPFLKILKLYFSWYIENRQDQKVHQ